MSTPASAPDPEVAEAARVAAVRRAAVLARTPSERLALIAALCRQGSLLTSRG